MAARAPGWFEAVKSPNGWTYTLNPANRQPSPWPAWTRWLLGAVTIALIVSGVGLLRWCVATTSGSAWDGKWVLYGLSGLVYLGGGVGLAIDQIRRRAGRCELRLDAGAIRAIWRLGPISWSKTVRRSDAAQLAGIWPLPDQRFAAEGRDGGNRRPQVFLPLGKLDGLSVHVHSAPSATGPTSSGGPPNTFRDVWS